MSEKTVGTVGNIYEERKSHKIGKVINTDAEASKVTMSEVETGEEFTVSYSAFKRSWRKHICVEETVDESIISELPQMSFDAFVHNVKSVRKAVGAESEIENGKQYELSIDNIVVFRMITVESDNMIAVKMLPDIFDGKNFSDDFNMDVHFDFDDAEKLTVTVYIKGENVETVLPCLIENTKTINLYGYTVEESEEN